MDEPQPVEPRRVRRTRVARLVAWIVLLVSAVVVAVVILVDVGPPSEAQLRQQAVGGRSELLIGVKDDTPGVSQRDALGVYRGFDIEIAYLVAGDLGFRPDQVRFLSIETEDRARMQAYDENTRRFVTVDLVVASFSITQERIAAGVHFAGPYLSTQQSVVTRTDHAPVTSLDQLAGQQVCTLTTSTSSIAAKNAGLHPAGRNEISECVAGLRRKEFDAVTTDAAILAGFVAEPSDVPLTHHDIGQDGDELWGIACGDNPALQKLVNLYLYRSRNDPNDRRWENAYETYLRSEQAASPKQQVAIDHQPVVPAVEVRTWPWQR